MKPVGDKNYHIQVLSSSERVRNQLQALPDCYVISFVDDIPVDSADLIFSEKVLYDAKCPWVMINSMEIYRAIESFHAGASGVLTQSFCANEIQSCIESIQNDSIFLNPDLTQIMAMRQIQKMLKPFNQLSSREFDVFCLLAESCSIETIASHLALSIKTIFNCQTQIKSKMDIKNIQQIREIANKHGLINADPL